MSIDGIIANELILNADEKYRQFHSSLVLGVENILGVRAPITRAIAKKYANTDTGKHFMASLPHKFYDEYMVHGYMIGYLKCDSESKKKYIRELLPFIDNWAVCDSCVSNLKTFFKKPDEVFGFVKELLRSDKEYSIRFALVCLLSYYVDDDHIDEMLELTSKVTNASYYVKMAQAWLISVALVKEYDRTLPILTENMLDIWVHNKAIAKAKESIRIDKETKTYLTSLKRGVK